MAKNNASRNTSASPAGRMRDTVALDWVAKVGAALVGREVLISFSGVLVARVQFMVAPLFQEGWVHVRAMDRRVTHRASLILRRLIVKGGRAGRVGERRGVAGKAEQVHVAHFEQMYVRRAVRRMARDAAFDLHWLVLVNKWTALIFVAVIANRVHRRGAAQLVRTLGAVGIVAIRALYESFVHAVGDGQLEVRLLG